ERSQPTLKGAPSYNAITSAIQISRVQLRHCCPPDEASRTELGIGFAALLCFTFGQTAFTTCQPATACSRRAAFFSWRLRLATHLQTTKPRLTKGCYRECHPIICAQNPGIAHTSVRRESARATKA